MFDNTDLRQFLQDHFQFSEFRGRQKESLQRLLAGESHLLLMPTGGGKSLIYQFLALWNRQPVLVVSPLIALMEDQVRKARSFGIRATHLSSLVDPQERAYRLADMVKEKHQLIFVTPERLRKPEFLEAALKIHWSCLVVDEAHCISQWGHDFRPDYSRISEFWEVIRKPPVLALTATATLEVQKDIFRSLGLSLESPVLDADLNRPNLALQVKECLGFDEKKDRLFEILQSPSAGMTLVYFSLIQSLQRVSLALKKAGISHLIYHGDLHPRERGKQQRIFERAERGVMLATPAFGLGIDKSNIRQLIHFEIPGSLESYFQEIGRAGRDGEESQVELLFDEEDLLVQMDFLKWAHPDLEFMSSLLQVLIKDSSIVQQQGLEYLREKMNFKNRRDFRVDATINIFSRSGILEKDESSRSRFPYILQTDARQRLGEFLKPEILLKHQQKKLLQMVQWAKDRHRCRMRGLLEPFSSHLVHECGKCDVCR